MKRVIPCLVSCASLALGTSVFGRDGKIAALCTGYLKGEVLLDAALAKAGIKVDAAILARAVEDQKKRDAMR